MVLWRRVQRDLYDCSKSFEEAGVKVITYDHGNTAHLFGTITGPLGTPYEGGTFNIDIELPDEYPFKPPKLQFATKVWHPNISSQTGDVCLDTKQQEWSHAQTLKATLLMLQVLLSSPEPNNPQDNDVAKQYLTEYQKFLETARSWTQTFAMVPSLNAGDPKGDAQATVRKGPKNIGGTSKTWLSKGYLCSS